VRIFPLARGLVLCAGVAFLAGCHTYSLVENPPLGSDVRLRVPVSSPLSRTVDVVSLEGQLVEDGDTLTLATETRRQLGAYSELMQYDTVRLARTQVNSVELKEFSTSRSVMLGVAITGGAVLGGLLGFGLFGGAKDPRGGGDPIQTTVISRSLVSTLLGLVFR